MKLYLRGKSYWCRFTVDGVQVRRPTGERTKQAAMARAVEIFGATRSHSLLPTVAAPAPILRDFTEGYFLEWVGGSSRIKDRTRQSYRYGVQLLRRQAVFAMRLDAITSEDVDMIRIPGSPSTHNCALRTLRRIFSLAAKKGHVTRPPAIALLEERRREKLIDSMTEQAVAAVLNGKGSRNGSLATALYVILDCGMRPMEIAQMRIEDVNFSAGRIHVPKSKTRAGERYLPMTNRVKQKLFARIGDRTEGWVFPSPKHPGRCILPTSLSHAWKKAAGAAGLPADVHLYCARHTFATDAMRITGNAFLVMKALGHTELSTTQRYQHHELDGIGALMDRRNMDRAGTVQ